MIKVRCVSVLLLAAFVTACGGPFPYIPPGLEDLAVKAGDVSTYLARQRADQFAFGNAELGTAANTVRSPGRIGVRVTAVGSGTPSLAGVPIRAGDARASELAVTTGTSLAVAGEGSLQLFRGFGTGETRPFSVDLVGRASVVSGLPSNRLNVDGGKLGGALGLRIGITGDRENTPAISAVFMQGLLPGVSFESDPEPVEGGGTAVISMQDMKLTSTAARIALSKQFGALGVTGGYGVDVITINGTAVARIEGRPEVNEGSAAHTETELRRTNLFGGVTYRTRGVVFGGEIGRMAGGKGPDELNTFASGGGSRIYASVGVRVEN